MLNKRGSDQQTRITSASKSDSTVSSLPGCAAPQRPPKIGRSP